MRTRSRFALLFSLLGAAVAAVGFMSIYAVVGRDAARRLPIAAESVLARGARSALDGSRPEASRLEAATDALLEARTLLAEGRVMARDVVVRLALEVAAILLTVVTAACLAFYALSRLVTRGLGDLASGAVLVQDDRSRRFDRSSDPELDAVAAALNRLLDLVDDQERRLAEASRLEGWREVASFLAHQLKNPLAALRLAAGNARLALERGDEALAGESLEIADSEAERLAGLINRFRDLAPSGLDYYARPGDTDLLALVRACASRAEMGGAKVEIGPEIEPGPRVAMDGALLEQALGNLFANSVEAAAGAPLSIRVGVSVGGGTALLEMSDSNSGFDPSLLPRLGVERVTTKREGTGLGLILVRRLLAAQGGSLELFASPAGGLGARLELPLAGKGGRA